MKKETHNVTLAVDIRPNTSQVVQHLQIFYSFLSIILYLVKETDCYGPQLTQPTFTGGKSADFHS